MKLDTRVYTAIVVKPTLKRFALMPQEEQAATWQQNAIAVKLPHFWTINPEIWFHQAEAQFAWRYVVSEETKYYHVLAALDQNTAQCLLDLLSNPPAATKYTAIKQHLLSTFALSETDRAAKLLNMPPLGDRKPSALMDEMLVLLGNHQACFIFKHLFLQHMPDDIRITLASEQTDDLRRLAQKADALWLAQLQTPELCKVEQARLRKQYQKINNQKDFCYHHRCYGKNTRQCRPPCAF